MPTDIPLTPVDAGDFARWLTDARTTQFDGADADVPCGECNACCKSCYFIHVTPNDTAALAAIPQELLFAAPGLPPGHYVMGYDESGHCPMLVDDRCSIYHARPQTCRAYDCRIFAACEMAPGEADKALVSERTQRWRFSFASSLDAATQQRIARAAQWLQTEQHNPASELPADFLPSNSTQLAVMALQVFELFTDEPTQHTVGAEFAASVVERARQQR